MKFSHPIRILLALVLIVVPTKAEEPVAAHPASGRPIKLLTIGNSFARDASTYLSGLAKAGGHDFLLFQANPGGCTLQMHADWITAHEADPESPEGKPYPANFTPQRDGLPQGKRYSLAEILAAEDWDFVTIQQVSLLSFKPETFEPYAKAIIDCIRENAPEAEILVHQTWAYREDYPGFADGTFTQEMMFEQLSAAYQGLAERYGLRVIPVGEAFQKARSLPRWSFRFPDPDFNYGSPLKGTRPDQTGSLNVGWYVTEFQKMVPIGSALGSEGKETETGQAKPIDESLSQAGEPSPDAVEAVVQMKEVTAYRAGLDFKHCNAEGRFIGSTVFYGAISGENVSENPYTPAGIAPEDVITIKGIADEVLNK